MSVVTAIPGVPAPQMPLGSNAHPLDPLSAEEIWSACEVLKTVQQLGAECCFAMVQLHEPPKAQVLALHAAFPKESRTRSPV
jgi:Cu2+-containing amine oxidase